MFNSSSLRSGAVPTVVASVALFVVAAPAMAADLPPGASSTASPPEFDVDAREQRDILSYPMEAELPTDEFAWINFEAFGVAAGRFVIVGARDNERLPNGRLAHGRVLCELAPDPNSDAAPHAWACRTRISVGPMNGRGMWWTQVAYADCPADGSPYASTSTVRYRLTGVMAPTRPTLPRRHVKVAASHLEASPDAAGGLGFPAAARVPVRCTEMSADQKPGPVIGIPQSWDCQNVRVTLRTAGRVSIGGSAPRRWTLGRASNAILVNRVKRVSVLLDTGRASVTQALAIERMLRARGRLRVIATVTARSRWDGKTRRARRMLVLHAPKRRPHGCRTGCLQP